MASSPQNADRGGFTMQGESTDTTLKSRTPRSARLTGPWGGFLLTRHERGIVHVKLTGRLSSRTLRDLEARLARLDARTSPVFLVLDASHLQHIPVEVALQVAERERRWRKRGVVALWIGLSRYLANLLVLACRSDEQLPVLPDLGTARALIRRLDGATALIARGRLEMCTTLVH